MDKKLVRALLARLNPGDTVVIRKNDGDTVRAVFRHAARVGHTLLGVFDAGDRVEMVGTHRRLRQNILSITFPNGTVFGSVAAEKPSARPDPDVAERLYTVGLDIVNRFRNGESVQVLLARADGTIHECEVLAASRLRGRRKQVELRLRDREGSETFTVRTWRDSAMFSAMEILNSGESEPATEAESDSAATEDVPMPMAAE